MTGRILERLIIIITMEIALIKTKPKNKPSQQVINNSRQQEENRGTEKKKKKSQ
jgi:hypothetical protein